jgi:hypothetical protein
VGAIGGRIALFLTALGLAVSASAEQTIRFAEPVDIPLQGSATAFDAYGRRFSLNLTDNERVLQKLPAQRKQQLARYRLLRGSLEGAPKSWVRLTQSTRGVEGAIWDGKELYAVAPYESVAPFLTTPLDAAPDQTVVYRLSDARDTLPRDFCDLESGTAEAQVTGLDQYQALVSEIQGEIITPVVSQQLEIALIADSDFQKAEQDPLAAMMARLNIVDGIFSEQIGLLVLATEIRFMAADTDPFTATKGTTLLEQLGAYRDANSAVRARGLAHLMTGKDLDGTTAGIAYVGTVCDVKRGVSVSQRTYGTTISALIMAHELGHNLGAEHDGVDGTDCAHVGDGFIMAPSVSGYSTFSYCSIESMQAVLSSASCVKPAEYADVAVAADAYSVAGEGGRPFTLPFTVSSHGNLGAEDVELTVTLPSNIAAVIESASTSLGSCEVAGLVAVCRMGELAEGGSARVSVIARSNMAGSFNVQAGVQSSNDRLSFNNRTVLPVTLRSGIDASVSLSAKQADLLVGSELELYADVTSRRALAVRNATLAVNLNQPVSSATMAGAQCTVNASSLSCLIEEIPAGTSRRLTLSAIARNAGPLSANATISVAGDGDMHNNASALSGWVQAERDVELSTMATVSEFSVGAVLDIPFTLRSRGSVPADNVALLVSLPATSLVVETIEATGASCTAPSENLRRCEFGTLAPGESRQVTLRVRGSDPLTADVVASAITTNDGYMANNNARVRLGIDHEVDLAVALASGGAGLEGEEFEGEVTLRSQGREAAIGATLDIDLHAAGMLRSARIHDGAACDLLSVTRARCALPTVAPSGQVHVSYAATFAAPGDYDVTFTARTPGDTGADNDQLVRAVLVRPYLDVAVTGTPGMDGLLAGQERVKTFTVTAGKRDLATARFVASHAAPALAVEAISAPAGDCRVDSTLGGVCEFPGLAATSSTEVKVTYRAADQASVAHVAVAVSTPGDVVPGNNSLTARVTTLAATDVALRVNGSVTGASGTVLTFPLIELMNGTVSAVSPWVEVTLPSGSSVIDVSAGQAVCAGTSTLRCEFTTLGASETASLSFTFRAASSGKFTAQVRSGAGNDTNPANDSRDVAIDIAAEPSQPAPGGSGASASSGGGGQMDWFALCVLALLKFSFVQLARRRSQPAH